MHVAPPLSSESISNTWVVRPTSQFTNRRPRTSRRSSNNGLPTPLLPEASSSDSSVKGLSGEGDDIEGETYRPSKHYSQESSDRRLTYKPSFSKTTFQWIRGELIGKGNYGRVYLAMNATTGEIMAVKQVELPRTASDKINAHQLDVMKALKFESDTLRDLDHPNIVQYLGFEESQDFLSIFLEYVPGGTISYLLREHGSLREEVTKSFLSQILNGLEYLHTKKILHRDLKADNILVEPSGVCKISDFGISKKAGEVNRGRAFTSMKGTVFWMAPEVLANEGKGYDVKVDIWSVGCIALEMWSGKRPWSGEQSMLPVMLKLFTEKLPPPVPTEVVLTEMAENFRLECFHADPQKRPHAAALKKHPYLTLAQDWVFDMSDVAANSRSTRPPQTTQTSQLSKVRSKNRLTGEKSRSIGTISTVKPSKPSTKPRLPTLSIPDWTNPATVVKMSHFVRSPSPPVVYITPPGSPRKSAQAPAERRGSIHISETSEGRKSSRSQKRFIVCNPDCDDEEDRQPPTSQGISRKPTFIYTPPPLPAVDTTISSVLPTPPKALHKAASSYLTHSPASAPVRSTTVSHPSPQTPASPIVKSVRRLPVSPPQVASSFISRDRAHTVSSGQPSKSRREVEQNFAAWVAVDRKQIASSNPAKRTVRRLPISPPLKTSASISHITSAASMSLARQKSVPDVSIFSYQPTLNRNTSPLKTSISNDSDLEDQENSQSEASTSTQSLALPKHAQNRESLWAKRPPTQDVYEHLESFFPNHDLDLPVVGSNNNDPRAESAEQATRHRKIDGRKSIRMIAKEQIYRSHIDPSYCRRRTRLWNSHMQELKNNR